MRRGFSLIEVLLVLVVVCLIAMLAYPSYAAYVTRTRRSEGQLALMERMQQQERYYSQHQRYLAFGAGSTEPDAARLAWWSGQAPENSAYELSGAACPGRSLAECIEIRAEPGTGRVDGRFRDPDCGTLTLNSEGLRSPAAGLLRCWP